MYIKTNMKVIKENWLEVVCVSAVVLMGIRILVHVINNPELVSFCL